jgi:thiosulfate/3-mercaptopyruvate sulfurtransferase
MQPKQIARALVIRALAAIAILSPYSSIHSQNYDPTASSASATSIPNTQLIQPAAMAALLRSSGTERPLVLQVGSRLMFAQAHIAGSVFAGPGSQPSGSELIEKRVAATGKNKLIVIYCGCCPWNRCPNMGPAFKRLHDLGFTNVKAVYFANNFGDDWVAKGYQVESGD